MVNWDILLKKNENWNKNFVASHCRGRKQRPSSGRVACLCWKLDDGSASVKQNRHPVSSTNYTSDPVSIFRCLLVRVSKPRDLYLELFDRSEIWQATRQQGYRRACQISKRCDNLDYQSRGFVTSRDLTARRFIKYWNGAQISHYRHITREFTTSRKTELAT